MITRSFWILTVMGTGSWAAELGHGSAAPVDGKADRLKPYVWHGNHSILTAEGYLARNVDLVLPADVGHPGPFTRQQAIAEAKKACESNFQDKLRKLAARSSGYYISTWPETYAKELKHLSTAENPLDGTKLPNTLGFALTRAYVECSEIAYEARYGQRPLGIILSRKKGELGGVVAYHVTCAKRRSSAERDLLAAYVNCREMKADRSLSEEEKKTLARTMNCDDADFIAQVKKAPRLKVPDLEQVSCLPFPGSEAPTT